MAARLGRPLLLLAAAAAVALAGNIAVISDPPAGNGFTQMAYDAAQAIDGKYPNMNVHHKAVLPTSGVCEAFMDANGANHSIIFVVNFLLANCVDGKAASFPSTWFVLVDSCLFPNNHPNVICGVFAEQEPSYAAGYLAGKVSSTGVLGIVGGVPIPPVKNLFNGFALGARASCPECKVEGVFVNSFFHPTNAESVATYLVNDVGADVVFGCGGGTGSLAIKKAAQLGAHAVGVDVDEFETTFAGEPASVKQKLLTSVMKKVHVAIDVITAILLGKSPGDNIPEAAGNNVMLDYASSTTGLADCNTACETIGHATWMSAKSIESQLSARTLTVNLGFPPHLPLVAGGTLKPNTFYTAANTASPPAPRWQHAMTSFNTGDQEYLAVFGGKNLTTTMGDLWLYNIGSTMWLNGDHGMTTNITQKPPGLAKACAAAIGKMVVIVGGRKADNTQSNSVYSYTFQGAWVNDLVTQTWATRAVTGTGPSVEGAACTALDASGSDSQCLFVFGGRTLTTEKNDVHKLCASGTAAPWSWEMIYAGGSTGTEPSIREGSGLLVADGAVVGSSAAKALVVVAGFKGANALKDVWVLPLPPATGVWAKLADLPKVLRSTPLVFAADVEGGSKVLVVQVTSDEPGIGFGAFTYDQAADAWISQRATDSGRRLGTILTGTVKASAARDSNGQNFMFGGQDGNNAFQNSLVVSKFVPLTECPAGQQPIGITCTACPVGKLSTGGTGVLCSPAPAGHFVNTTGASVATECAAGTFAEASAGGASACANCDKGHSTQGRVGQATCFQCTRGHYAGVGQEDCTRCPLGEFASVFGATACEQCNAGFSTAFPGAINAQECACPAGAFLQGETCQTVPDGMTSTFGADYSNFGNAETSPMLQPGYFSSLSNPLSVYKCNPTQSCPGGKPDQCPKNLQGLMCTQCPEVAGHNYFHGHDGCNKCGAQWLFTVFLLLLVIPICFGAHYMMNNRITNKASTMLIWGTSLGILVATFQTLGVFSLMSLSWPSPLKEILDFMGIFMLDLDLIYITCLFGKGDHVRYVLSVVGVFYVYMIFIVLLVVSSCLSKTKRGHQWTVLNTIGAMTQAAFTTMVSVSLQMATLYVHPNGKTSVTKFPSILAESSEYPVMVIFGTALLLIAVGFYASAAWACWRAPSLTFSSGSFTAATRFLFIRFRPDAWWYGMVVVTRALLLSLTVTVCGGSPHSEIIFATFVLALPMAACLRWWPFKAPVLNLVDCSLSLAMVMLLVSGGAFLDKAANQGGYKVLLVVEVAVIFASIGLVLLMGLVSLVKKGRMGTPSDFFLLRTAPDPQAFAEKLRAVARDVADCCELHRVVEEMLIYDIQALEYVMHIMFTAKVSGEGSGNRSAKRIHSFTGVSREDGQRSSVNKAGEMDEWPAHREAAQTSGAPQPQESHEAAVTCRAMQ